MKSCVSEKKECCGCSACYAICPQNAISMKPDEKGFVYPVIDENKCINCNLCKKVCAFAKDTQFCFGEEPIAAYATKHIDENVRSQSRSGGVFTAITDYILSEGGCVFGATIDSGFVVRHSKADTQEERNKMRGSKYVQSDMGDMFREVKKELQAGRKVAFAGTGCQVAGLRSYLQKDYENLYAFDLLCYGVPSPLIWKEYVDLMQKRYRGKITKIQFRDKAYLGWDVHIESFQIGNKKKYSRNYSKLFIDKYILRDSCFNCKYTNMQRTGDFTLADFWGVNKFFDDYDDNKGVSLLFVNSPKAQGLFSLEEIQKQIDCHKCEHYNFIHPNLKHGEKQPKDMEQFWDDYHQYGIRYILKKYGMWNLLRNMREIKSYTIIYFKRRIRKK